LLLVTRVAEKPPGCASTKRTTRIALSHSWLVKVEAESSVAIMTPDSDTHPRLEPPEYALTAKLLLSPGATVSADAKRMGFGVLKAKYASLVLLKR
jgi:hypothetical protein